MIDDREVIILVTDDREVANIFNEYFINITEVLGIHEPEDILMTIDGLHDPIEVASKKFSSHPSIDLIYKNKKQKLFNDSFINGTFQSEISWKNALGRFVNLFVHFGRNFTTPLSFKSSYATDNNHNNPLRCLNLFSSSPFLKLSNFNTYPRTLKLLQCCIEVND